MILLLEELLEKVCWDVFRVRQREGLRKIY